ncbi:RNA polymerase sigma factor [Nocardioides sambongensis]|uniref:RNA polymerase sigma factor n=1 Tax=Nocardioides sambongensis TaxID=2589074 RepID=UPI0011293D04|nr:sigma-70 family RNA polymerase sigma factor [Nocardioides sambongensis]
MTVTDPLSTIVSAARKGDQHAWDTLVDRFLPLVGAVVRGHRLNAADGDDVSQTVWLRLVEHLGDLREPAALPGWLRTTTRNECLRVLSARGRMRPTDPQDEAGGLDAIAEDVAESDLLAAERHRLLLAALAELPAARRDLLLLLLEDPPVAYEEISRRLGIPVGSIGPTRARALDQLRRTASLRGLAGDEATGGGDAG